MAGNLVLCGFMGCGKTTIGKRAARMLGREFRDLDRYIEEKTGMTISRIFAEQGEARFRELETQAVREAAAGEGLVIACGGGTVLSQKNVDAFHAGGDRIVFLDVPLAVLQERLRNDKKRPLLQRPDREDFIAKLWRERRPLYKAAADVTLVGSAPVWVTARRTAAYASRPSPQKAAGTRRRGKQKYVGKGRKPE